VLPSNVFAAIGERQRQVRKASHCDPMSSSLCYCLFALLVDAILEHIHLWWHACEAAPVERPYAVFDLDQWFSTRVVNHCWRRSRVD